MIQESVIDSALNRLQAHFGSRVVIRPPASAAELAELEAGAGPLPRDLIIFLSTCNGFRVELKEAGKVGHVCCIREMLETLDDTTNLASAIGLVPVGHDAELDQAWIVTGPGPVHGRIIRWDPRAPGARLLASSFGDYLERWIEYLIECFDHQGRPRLDRLRPKFNSDYVVRRDPHGGTLGNDPEVLDFLRQLDHAVPTGDDFE